MDVNFSDIFYLSSHEKCQESVGKRRNVILVNSKRMTPNHTAKPTYCRFKFLNPELVGVELSKGQIVLDRPIAVGFTILELSKVLMFEFWYGVIKTTI